MLKKKIFFSIKRKIAVDFNLESGNIGLKYINPITEVAMEMITTTFITLGSAIDFKASDIDVQRAFFQKPVQK